MPAYELYLGPLRERFFRRNENFGSGVPKEQLRVILDKSRQLIKIANIP